MSEYRLLAHRFERRRPLIEGMVGDGVSDFVNSAPTTLDHLKTATESMAARATELAGYFGEAVKAGKAPLPLYR